MATVLTDLADELRQPRTSNGSHRFVDLAFERRGAEKPGCVAVRVLRLSGDQARDLVPHATALP